MKKFFIFFVFLLCSSFLIGENPQNSWKALEQATRALDEDDPASALRYAEIAKELRQKEYKEKRQHFVDYHCLFVKLFYYRNTFRRK